MLRQLVAPIALTLLAAACATERPLVGQASSLLASSLRRDAVTARIGKEPRICYESRNGFELCSWILSGRDATWEEFAQVLRTPRKLNVFCEFSTHDGLRSKPDACEMFARVALPYADAIQYVLDEPGVVEEGDARSVQARRALDSAQTLFELSRLVGDAPLECNRHSKSHQRCTWQAGNQTPGFQILSALSSGDGRVTLSCTLPYEASSRRADGCRVLP